MRKNYFVNCALVLYSTLLVAQSLPPKQAYPIHVKQIHSGHSLTDPVFSGHYQCLVAIVEGGVWDNIAKSTIPGSPLSVRWRDAPGYGQPDARHDIANWELLCITEGVPLAGVGGSSAEYLSLFVNNAWNNGNNGNGAPTLLWTTWTNIDNSDGPWRQLLDTHGAEWERMQDYANANRPSGAPPVYIIPGHKMMARIYDDIQLGIVPGVTNISQFFSDNIHLNLIGSYAFAMIHYACVFNRSPIGLPNNLVPNSPSHNVPAALATYLQTIVWDVVTSYPRTGIYLQVDTTKPSVPAGLASSNIAQQSFTLSWTASSDNVGVNSYEIFRNGNSIGTTNSTTYSVTGLSCATAYTMTIRARDAAGNVSDASTPLVVNTPACIIDVAAPSVPTGLASSAITTSSFTVSWTASTDNVGVTGYDVFVNGNLRTSVTGTTVNLSDLNHSTSYSITVRAKDAAGNLSAVSTPINVTTNAVVPGSTYRYLRLIAQGGVNANYDVYLREIDWMQGNTAYPQTHANSGSANVTATQNQSNAWSIYDGNNASIWSAGVTTYPYSITVDLGAGVAIAPTAIQIAIEWNERALSAFTCLGSNDNTNWTVLLTRSGLTSVDWTRDAVNRFNFSTIVTNIFTESVTKEVSLYPNPSSTDINLESKNEISMVEFFDLSGTLVHSKIVNSTSSKVSTEGLNPGLYMAKILLKDGTISINKFSIIK